MYKIRGLAGFFKIFFEYFNHTVEQLDRVEYAGLSYTNLKRGQWRLLTQQEIAMLKQKKH